MDDNYTWAKAIRVWATLMNRDEFGGAFADAVAAVQLATRNVMLCGSPMERFSDKLPTRSSHSPADADFSPIEELYGSYDPHNRLIEIFVRRVERDAPLYGGTFEDLLDLVRLHEYAHAAVHVGLGPHEILSTLRDLDDESGSTNWNRFTGRRTHAFLVLDAASHELLAQAVTYACLSSVSEQRSAHLKMVFRNLERKQPPHYFVPEDVKERAAVVRWPLVLEVARRETDVLQGPAFSLHGGLLALASSLGEPTPSVSEREWAVTFSDPGAQEELTNGLRAEEPRQVTDANGLRFLIDRLGGLKIEIFAREHPPPHFRVICAGDSANYRISDCTQLNGKLQGHYRAIREWHSKHKAMLIAAWNQHRPSDCPVGEYREP